MTNRARPPAVLILLSLALMSCGPLFPAPTDEIAYFVIEGQKGEGRTKEEPHGISLLVRETKANRFINSHKIVFSEDSAQRGYYQLARWVEPPPSRISTLLLEKLEQANVSETVSRLGSAALGDYQLNMELIEYYHDIRSRPGTAVVQISVELVDLAQRTMLAQAAFSASEPATSYSAEGAVQGLTIATNRVLNDIVHWISEQLSGIVSTESPDA